MTETKSATVDIAIVGGGMVGVSLALLLSRMLPEYRVTLIEAYPVGLDGAYTPSFDGRSTAVSQGSRQIFEQLALWAQLGKYCTPITRIHVSDRGHTGSARMSAQEQRVPALGYVIENSWLGRVLLEELLKTPSIEVLAPVQVNGVTATEQGMRLRLAAGETIDAKLLIVADGANSATRRMLAIDTHETSYSQVGLVANLALGQPHNNIAYERFTDQGPMALLPLQFLSGSPRASLVWTLSEEQAVVLQDCDEAAFLHALQQRFGWRLGMFKKVGERNAYPLKLVIANEQVRRNLVVVGNAAHSLHPVAGQGFNLALRDCAILAATLVEGVAEGYDCGDLSVLQRYADQQQADQQRTIWLSDLLPKAFTLRTPALVGARNLSLLAMEASPPLRRSFASLGMGLLGKSPQLGGIISPQLDGNVNPQQGEVHEA